MGASPILRGIAYRPVQLWSGDLTIAPCHQVPRSPSNAFGGAVTYLGHAGRTKEIVRCR
jgi:hypothetical protein